MMSAPLRSGTQRHHHDGPGLAEAGRSALPCGSSEQLEGVITDEDSGALAAAADMLMVLTVSPDLDGQRTSVRDAIEGPTPDAHGPMPMGSRPDTARSWRGPNRSPSQAITTGLGGGGGAASTFAARWMTRTSGRLLEQRRRWRPRRARQARWLRDLILGAQHCDPHDQHDGVR